MNAAICYLLVWVPQRNRINRRYTGTGVDAYLSYLYKELAHETMKTETSKAAVSEQETQDSPQYSSSLSPSLSPGAGGNHRPHSNTVRKRRSYYSAPYFIHSFNRLDEAHRHWGKGKEPALRCLQIQMLISSKNTLTDPPRVTI